MNFSQGFANGSFLFRKIAWYKVIWLYKAYFATFRTYETLRKHIYVSHTKINVCVCVCSNANPLQYYVLHVLRKADRWLSVVYFQFMHRLGRPHYVWDEYLYSVL